MIIRSVHIKEFRCIREARIQLGPFTALVGPNASGKTTALQALRIYQRGFLRADAWRHSGHPSIAFEYGQGNGSSFDSHGVTRGKGHNSQQLRLDVNALRQENRLAAAPQLDELGATLTNVFATLSRKQQDAVAREVCRLAPVFGDVGVVPTHDGHHRLRFQDRWKDDLWLTPDEVSDGTMLLVAFLTLPYQAQPPDVLTIEEPDRGLHPFLMGEVIHLLRSLSTGAIGSKPIQVVLATHSAELLEHIQPEEVRFLDRDPTDGAVTVRVVDPTKPDWQRSYREYGESLGSAWLSGALGGVPSP